MKHISEINTLYDVLPDEDDYKKVSNNPRLSVAMRDLEEATRKAIEIIEENNGD